jgi:hypothetical protein
VDQIDIQTATDIAGTLDASQADVGDDNLVGGPGRDHIHAGAGADTVDAGDGGDLIEGVRLGQSFIGGVNSFSVTDDNAVDQIVCSGNTPAPGDFADRGIGDAVQMGSGDRVDLDCEFVNQLVTCPSGSSCEVVATVTASSAASASTSLASAAASKRSGKQQTLGNEKTKLRSGQVGTVEIRLSKKKAKKTLGKRSRMSATLKVELERKGKDKKKKVRFKLKRRQGAYPGGSKRTLGGVPSPRGRRAVGVAQRRRAAVPRTGRGTAAASVGERECVTARRSRRSPTRTS